MEPRQIQESRRLGVGALPPWPSPALATERNPGELTFEKLAWWFNPIGPNPSSVEYWDDAAMDPEFV